MIVRLLLVALVLLVLVVPASAEVRSGVTNPEVVQRALAVAAGVHPVGCEVVVEEGPLENWTTDGGVREAKAEAHHPTCTIRLSPGYPAQATWAVLCSVMVHEQGHLAGLDHSDDPTDNMHKTGPHHSACGPSDLEVARAQERVRAREVQIERLADKIDALRDRAIDLKYRSRSLRRVARRTHGARKRRAIHRALRVDRRLRVVLSELRVMREQYARLVKSEQ